MSEQASDPDKFKAEQRRRWDATAVAWKKSWDKFERAAQRVSDRLLEMARVQPGQRVLDVATGIGEPAVSAARRVGPSGSVVAIDHSAEMLRLARERASALNLHNLDFRQMDAQELDLQDGFDAIVCRWGLMFLPDLPGALQRMRRLLVPGGRLAAAVWSSAERVPMLGLVQQVSRQLEIPPPPAGTLGPLSLADVGALEQTLRQAGFTEVTSEPITVTFEFASADEYAGFQREVNSCLRDLLAEQPAETQTRFWGTLAAAAAPWSDAQGVVRFPNECFCVTGQR